jgi:dolichol-phosphate mannosyltransferase
MPRTLVILPTYNERATIGDVLERTLRSAPHVNLLVVDDGSPDGTANVVDEVARRDARVRLLQRGAKGGLASAYLAGFRSALDDGCDLIGEMDADLSHQPEELPRLLEGARRHDLTVGSRYVPGGSVTNWGLTRRILSRGGNLYARWALGFPVADATSGYRVFRRGLLATLVEQGVRSEGYGFQIELAYRAWAGGYAVGEVPITFRERQHGHSKISRRIVFEALASVAVWAVRDRILPVRAQASGRRPLEGPPGRRTSSGEAQSPPEGPVTPRRGAPTER